ncbi:MAG: type II toxin-antitoxin system YoeB family toxin [Marinospirillum sp.]|uniref:type II toxin-antitoxin system YoeB family toxin n=1 Tax=Marinospirillum sp. TaxID=2183934 RepID=UPI001A0C5EF3|nr:type II toxin-antitoxin system YoeB family toxin [Marinospirillum sp.]MBE0507993.1 type II toxin-antitoxin system YoeB family toxin [Marinospirillum sp.]
MDAISYTSARSNLAQMMQQVCDDHSPSKRINEEDRMVYKTIDDTLLIAQLCYHY